MDGVISVFRRSDFLGLTLASRSSEATPLQRAYGDDGIVGVLDSGFQTELMCESFSTYPRTYDLLHAWTVFSEIESRGCSAEDLLIEMDQILRPESCHHKKLAVRHKPRERILDCVNMGWWLSEVEPRIDAFSPDEERVLIARKKLCCPEAVSLE